MSTIADALEIAVKHHQAGQLVQAAQMYREILRVDPREADAWYLVGVLSHQLGRHEEAIEHIQRAIALKPDRAQYHANLGAVYVAAGRPRDAVTSCERALQLDPNSADGYHHLGSAFRAQGKVKEAIACFERVLQLKPGLAQAHYDLGAALQELGNVNDAVAKYERTLEIEPQHVRAFYHLSDALRQVGEPLSDEHISRLKDRLAHGNLSPGDTSLLCFSLAGALDVRSEYDEAFRYYQHANDLWQQSLAQRSIVFDPDAHRRMIDELLATFDREAFTRLRPLGVDSELPVFVVGLPRSGLTLVEQILASHPQIAGAGERRDIEQLAATIPPGLNSTESYAACLPRIDPPTAHALAQRYLGDLASGAVYDIDHAPGSLLQLGAALRVIDKTPANFLHLGFIAALFPKARVIHCRRDPRDACLSCYFQPIPAVWTSSLEQLGFYYRQYERLMAHWDAVLPLQVHEVAYEDLVADTERVARELIAFSGLAWDERCLAYYRNPRAVQAASNLQVRRPIYTDAVRRWEKYQKHLDPLIEALHLADRDARRVPRPG
jgi:tetratricopeptide (TPR) repeat protein